MPLNQNHQRSNRNEDTGIPAAPSTPLAGRSARRRSLPFARSSEVPQSCHYGHLRGVEVATRWLTAAPLRSPVCAGSLAPCRARRTDREFCCCEDPHRPFLRQWDWKQLLEPLLTARAPLATAFSCDNEKHDFQLKLIHSSSVLGPVCSLALMLHPSPLFFLLSLLCSCPALIFG